MSSNCTHQSVEHHIITLVFKSNQIIKRLEKGKTRCSILDISEEIIFLQVGMTTGATIHTTEGLKMTVTRRTRPPIMPKLEKTMFEVDESTSGPEGETQLGPKSEVSSANS